MIIPIGAQNAYVLNQGIQRNHHLTTAAICSFFDVLFISLGVFGGGAILAQHELLLLFVTIGGVAFLVYYGYLSLRSAFEDVKGVTSVKHNVKGRRSVMLGALAVTVLNPHVYLDTIVVLGSIGGQLDHDNRVSFALGTTMASFIWFYGLSIGAAKFAPILTKPTVKRSIDIGVATIMFVIAATLLKSLWLQYL
ncbi:Arginine exporter protein ArgO [Vibrio marisflavi CECT 7928]|uniref:Arginine exporter protein ArgO n=2 Tax=Vibrio marisflavi TaxID=1216040 RepID=A0ABN8E5N9_9VIBR|nr:Arginine exporter protein ArgO [Vibrio marisflavi CECT 7928]